MPPQPPATTVLRILATSDLHMHLRGYDYIADTVRSGSGLARAATVINNARAEAAHGCCVLFDNGDAIQGAAISDSLRDNPAEHPMATAMNQLNYDAIGLGNHDFDFGAPYLDRVSAQYRAPLVCSNLTDAGLRKLQPCVVLERQIACQDAVNRTIRIGVLSVIPPQTKQWNHSSFPEAAQITNMPEAAKQTAAHLRTLGADIVVLLAHSGIGSTAEGSNSENAALYLGALDNIDAIIAGHTHVVFPAPDTANDAGVDAINGTLAGTPTALPGFAGSHVAQIDLHLSNSDGRWVVIHHTSQALATADAVENPHTIAISEPVHHTTRARLARSVGAITQPMNSYFSLLQTSPEMALIAKAKQRLIREAVVNTSAEHLPLLAAVAPHASGGRSGPANFLNVATGPIQYRHILQLCPFEDEVWAAEMSGAEIHEWLERSAAIFSTLGADDLPLTRQNAPRFNFDALFGLSYEIDPSTPPRYALNGDVIDADAKRVSRVTYQGVPVGMDQRFLVAATNYRVAGGGRFPNLSADRAVMKSGITTQQALRHLIKSGESVEASVAEHWRLKTRFPTSAVFETSADALAHLGQINAFEPEALGVSDAGFLRVRLHLGS